VYLLEFLNLLVRHCKEFLPGLIVHLNSDLRSAMGASFLLGYGHILTDNQSVIANNPSPSANNPKATINSARSNFIKYSSRNTQRRRPGKLCNRA